MQLTGKDKRWSGVSGMLLAICLIFGSFFMMVPPVDVLLLGGEYPAMIWGDQLIVWRDILLLEYRWMLVAVALLLPAITLGAVRLAWNREAPTGGLNSWVRRLWPLALLPIVAAARLLADMLPQAVVTNVAFYLPVAVLAAILAPGWVVSASSDKPVSREGRWNLGVVLVAALVFYALGWDLAVTTGEHVGDEGHYLVQAESLYFDKDLDIKNQVIGNNGVIDQNLITQSKRGWQHVAPNSRGDGWYSWHPYGLPLILAPFWRKGIEVRYLILAFIAALGCLGMFRLSRRVGASLLTSIVATAGLGGSFYWAVFSARVLPEVLGATLLVWLFWAIQAQASRPWLATFVAAGCCAYMSPSHVRFLPLSLMGMGFFGLHGLCGRQPWPSKLIRLTVFSLLCGAGYAGYFALQGSMFASAAFVYGNSSVSETLFSFPMGMWATIADVVGILTVLPLFMWLIVATFAWILVDRKERFFAISVLVTFLACLLTSCSNSAGIGGSCVPGRYLLVVMPLLVPAAAVMLDRCSTWARGWFLFLGLASTMLLVQTVIMLPDVGRGFILPVPSLRGFPEWQGLFQPYSTFMEATVHPFARRWTTAYVIVGMVASLWLILRPALARRWAAGTLALVLAVGIVSHNVQAEYDPSGYRPKEISRRLVNLDMDRAVVQRVAPASFRFTRPHVVYNENSIPTNIPALPPNDWHYVDSSAVVTVVDLEGKPCREALTDAVMDTRWSGFAGTTNFPTLTFTFDRAVALCGIRFLSPDDRYPREVLVEGQALEGGGWQKLLPPARTSGCFWSGTDIVSGGEQGFRELRFPAQADGVSRLRVTFRMGDNPHEVRLSEVLFLEQAPAPDGKAPSFDDCVAALRAKGVKQFYGPRWVSNRLALDAARETAIGVPALVPGSAKEWAAYDPSRPCPVVLRDTTGFMVDVRDAARTSFVLRSLGLNLDETALGSYVLLVAARPGKDEDAARYPAFYWTEPGCFAADMGRFASRKADVVYQKAVQLHGAPGATELLTKALELCPAHEPARKALIEALKAGGQTDEAARNEAMLKAQAEPQVPARIGFAGGIELLGLELSAQKVKPGESLEITYFWRCPSAVESRRPTAFVHFVQGKKLFFQDDFKLLYELIPEDLRGQPFNEIFTERRTITVPDSVPPGEYEITLGLYNRKNKKRLKVDTDLPERRREVRLPVVLQVGP